MHWDCFQGHFWCKAVLQLSLLSVRLHMYDSILYGCSHAMQWLLLKSANFWVSSAEYYIGLLSLGQGHNVARLDTHALGSLQHAARLKTSWPGQWLHCLAAVVSICEYTVSNKRGLPCHRHDCGRSWELCPNTLYFVRATAPTALPSSAAHGLYQMILATAHLPASHTPNILYILNYIKYRFQLFNMHGNSFLTQQGSCSPL